MLSVFSSIFFGMIFFFILHFFVWRYYPSDNPRIFLLWSFAGIGIVLSLGVNILQTGIDFLSLWSIISLHVSIIILYTFIYAGVSRSVSLTLLWEIIHKGSIRFSDLAKQYQQSSRFEDRIALMQRMGWLHLETERVMLTCRGKRNARLFQILSKILGTRFQG